jgi:hypothetical protein
MFRANDADRLVEEVEHWPAVSLAEVMARTRDYRWGFALLEWERDRREIATPGFVSLDDMEACIADGWGRVNVLRRIYFWRRAELFASYPHIGPRWDHQAERPAVSSFQTEDRADRWSVLGSLPRVFAPQRAKPMPQPKRLSQPASPRGGDAMAQERWSWTGPLDISQRESVLEYERQLSERPPPTTDEQKARARDIARYYVADLVAAYQRLFDVLSDESVIEHFIAWRIAVTDTQIPRLDLDKVEQAQAMGKKIAHDHAARLRQRCAGIGLHDLVAHAQWWNLASVDVECPTVFLNAAEPLAQAISQDIIAKKLRMHAAPLAGSIKSAGRYEANIILDPARWPPAGFTEAVKARQAIIDAASWVGMGSLRTAELDQEPGVLERLVHRSRGDAA